jgi:multidrug efflux pump subunit AcrB
MVNSFFSPFRTVILFFAVSAIGLALIPKLSVDFKPRIIEPQIQVSYSGKRTSPEVMERTVTSPLENALSQVSGVKSISSQTRDNSGSITLIFEKGEDINFKKFEVSSILRNVYPKLPEGVSYPTVQQFGNTQNTNERDTKGPFLIYTINAPYAAFQIKKEVEEILKKPLTQIPEVESVDVSGAENLQVTVELDLPSLLRYRVDVGDVAAKISQSVGTEFPGMAMLEGEQYFLRIDRRLDEVQTLENLVLGTIDGKDLMIRDVGRIYLEEQEPNSYFRINGRNAIFMRVTPRDGVNKVLLSDQVKAAVDQAMNYLPADYAVSIQLDESVDLKKELDKIYQRTGLSILILTSFIFLASRNPRYLLTIFGGILVNISIASIFVYFLDVNINLYSLAGVAISFGLIVDNAIVMVDHLHRKHNSRIFLALLAASLTTIMALLAVFLLPDYLQRNLIDFAKIVSIMLGVSLLVALFFTPALYYLLFKEKLNRVNAVPIRSMRRKVRFFRGYQALIEWVVKRRKWAIFLLIWLFGFPIFYLPSRIADNDWYNKTLGNEKYLENVRPWVDKITGGSLRMFVKGAFSRFQFREPERTKLMVNARMQYGTTLEQMNTIIKNFEDFLIGYEGVDKFTTQVTSTPSARIEISFTDAHQTSAIPFMLKGELIARSLDWSGVNWSVFGIGQGFSAGSQNESIPSFSVEMWGYNYDELERQAEIMAEKLLAHKRIQEVDINALSGWNDRSMQEYILTFDPERLALSGHNQGEVIRMLRNRSKVTAPAGRLEIGDEIMPIFVKTAGSDQFSKYEMMEYALPLDTSRLVRVKDLASLEFVKTPNTIYKENRQYKRLVRFDYFGSHKFGSEYRDQVLEEMKQIMPVGYEAKAGGYFGWMYQKDQQTQYGLLFLLILGIFFISAILFESFKQPLLIISAIPISFIGLFLIFAIGNFSYDQGGYAAFLLLGGLVVNAAIFIVNDFNNNRKLKHHNRRVMKAVTGKATPILLTVISTCLGLVPFLLQGQSEVFWFSMAIGTIGGLMFSMVAVFFFLPVLMMRRNLIR